MKSNISSVQEIWGLIGETQKHLKELSISRKETEKSLRELSISQKESRKETEKSLRELSISQKESRKETEKSLRELSAEREKDMKELRDIQKETEHQIKKFSIETDRHIQKIGGRFNDRWGALVESLVEGNLVPLFQSRGIDIMQTHSRSTAQWKKSDNDIQTREFDIIVANGTEVVVVEVKTALSPKDVKSFIETLRDFKKYFPRYKTETIYGAVAYLKSESKAHFLAEKQGLFIIRATGDSASIVNGANFKPKTFS